MLRFANVHIAYTHYPSNLTVKQIFVQICLLHLCKTYFMILCFIIPDEMVPTEDFKSALCESLKDVTSQAEEFVTAIHEVLTSKKIYESNKYVLVICQL